MAFLASSNNGAVSSAMSSAGNSATGTPTHSQELLSLEQQLLASMQQNAPIVSSNTSTEPANNAQSTDPATASYLQQLLAHQMQQQQQQGSQPSSLPISPPAHSAVAQQTLTNDLIQQLASTLLVNPNLAALQPQLAGLQSTAQTSAGSQQQAANHGFTTANPNLAALSGLMSASPTLLPSLLNGGQSVGQTNPLAQYLLNNHTAQSQASQPQSVAALQQQQVLQRLMANGSAAGANGNLLALVQMLQNGNASEIANPNALQVYQQLVAQQAAQQSAVSSNQNHLALLQQIMAGQNSTPTNRLSSMTDMNQINQLASLLQQSQIPSQGDQTPSAYNEFLLRQQHTQHHLSNLSKQNSSNSLLAGLSATGLDSPTASNHPNHSAMPVDSPLAQQNVNNGTAQSASRQASSERLLTSAESVQDHISRLISENEAIVEPNPVLLKRRPYHRQSTSNSITSQTSDLAGCSSQRGSPGLFHQVPNHRLPTTRSQSMHESQMLSSMHCMNAAAGGSLTSGQPVVRQPYGQSTNQPGSSFACNFCNLKFPNDAGLKAHESRCSKREQLTKRLLLQKHQSQPQLQWPLINAQQQQQQLLVLQQQKLLAQQIHQSNIAALVGGGAGVAPDPVINGCSGRSSVPIGAGNGGARCSTMHQIVAEATASPPQTGSKNGTSSPSTSSTGSENRHPLKKRLLESVRNSDAHSATASPTSVTPIASNASSMPNIDMHEAQNSPAKIAKMDRLPSFGLSQSNAIHSNLPPSSSQTVQRTGVGGEIGDESSESRYPLEEEANLLGQANRLRVELSQILRKSQLSISQPQMSAQEQHQLLFAPILTSQSTEKCPKIMQNAILFCTSYIEAKISTKMPYVLTLEETILDAHRNENKSLSDPLSHGRSRNVTVELNTTRRSIPNHRQMTNGQSSYSSYKSQSLIDVEDETMQILLNLRNSAKPIKFLDYTTPTDLFRNRTTHSEYWTADAKDRVLGILNKPQQPLDVAQSSLLSIQRSNQTADLNVVHELKAMAEAQRPLSPKIEPKIENEMRDEEMIEFELEVENKPDQRLTETVTAKPRIHSMGKQHEEVEVYVRGRGRGRYICDRCGIRCKKPSMLKKHLKSHTNERPHMCLTCNFAFKTRGNLTKHFGSKAHRSKVASSLEMQKRDGEEGELRIATPEDEAEHRLIKLSELESKFINDQLDDESDNEEDHVEHPPCSQALSYHRFGQENILMERNTHTPPTLWTLCDTEARVFNWPKADDNRPLMRSLSAPPAALCSPIPSGKRRPLFKNNEDAYRFTAPVDLSPSANSDIDVTNGNIESSSTNRVANYVLPLNFSAASVGSSFDGTETPVTASTSGLNEFLAAETKDYACDLCQRKFRKPSDLHVHQLTHQIEQKQNTRARSYPCPECGLVQRSRAVLERHLELSHQVLTSTNGKPSNRVNATIEECSSTATASTTVSVTMGDYDRQFQTVSSASTTSLSNSNGSLAANVRKYWCNDCNIGFRTNGVLAKHLRSKNHAKNLTQQGKLPSDTMSLIANQPSLLNNIDATDCETARSSLSIDILNGIREQDQSPADPIQSTKSADESLECTEQIDPESPGPPKTTTEISIGISQKHGSFAKSTPLPIRLSNSHKRRNNDRSHGSPSRQRPRSGSCTIGISTIGQRRLLNSSFKESTWRPLGSQSGPATPRVNFGTRNFYSHMMTQSPVVANVWHPPHVDQLMEAERDRNETTPSNRSAEEMSESTGRSESSTPVHRNGISGGHVLSSGLPTNGTVSPTSTITRCQLCDIEYQSSGEFEIHMFADHVTMRDGKDFRCPKRNCDKVYPNRVSLRAHLHAHFYGGGATPTVDVRDEITTFGFSPSPDSVSMHRNSKSSTANGIVPHHSPGIPEPTHTVTAADSNSREEHNAAVEEQQNRLPPGNIACNMCNSSFVDAVTLQAHWLQDHLAQLNARSHVCTECDAGFTNAEALRIHTENHR
ncbi:Transcription factor HIVEP3 [Aphelenchoides besseyi]|nr:Transcription factor HIVEP3 [Aphelenchoides besseyi]